tara:strand:+ start:1634 stop:2062 length:429 start_codon:yes stop_codon:yes gene_type:complete
MPKLLQEIRTSDAERLNINAYDVRRQFVHKGKTKEDLHEYNRRIKAPFLVKGRRVRGRMVWDVFRLCGNSKPQLVASGFYWQEEAIAFARDRKLGRMSFKAGNIRGMFRAGNAGIIKPSSDIEAPGSGVVSVVGTSSGVLVK